MNTSKSKLLSSTIAAVLALSVSATAMTTQAHAGKNAKWIALGVGAGIVGTAIIASRHRDRDYDRASRWERHVDRCIRRYRSYDEDSDTYIDNYGRERRCRL